MTGAENDAKALVAEAEAMVERDGTGESVAEGFARLRDERAEKDATADTQPGSENARSLGCTCAVLDNNHGRFPVYTDEQGRDQWWITMTCPLHGDGTEFLKERS